MTREEIRTHILDALNESSTSPVFWSLAASVSGDAIQAASDFFEVF